MVDSFLLTPSALVAKASLLLQKSFTTIVPESLVLSPGFRKGRDRCASSA